MIVQNYPSLDAHLYLCVENPIQGQSILHGFCLQTRWLWRDGHSTWKTKTKLIDHKSMDTYPTWKSKYRLQIHKRHKTKIIDHKSKKTYPAWQGIPRLQIQEWNNPTIIRGARDYHFNHTSNWINWEQQKYLEIQGDIIDLSTITKFKPHKNHKCVELGP